MILSVASKDIEQAKIDVVLRSLLEQRTYFPVYPNDPKTPIEWSQFKRMMFERTPDVLLIPSDLTLFAKVSLFH